ncbi:MAG TPA: urease accessory protein UreD [Anaeromyxobacteraceae bacterium]
MSTELLPQAGDALPDLRAVACSRRAQPPAVSQVGAGRGRLAVAVVEGASAVVGCAASSPLHLFTPRPRGRSVSAMIATHGGGLLAGDTLDLDLELGRGAVGLVGTQAETKVYRSEGAWATQRLTARVGADAALALLPWPTSCFAAARYRQEQRFELADGASLLLLDAVTPGRSARGERWASHGYLSRNEVVLGGRVILSDAVRLVAGEGVPVAARMRAFELLATLVAVGPSLRAAAGAILGELAGRVPGPRDEVLAAASPLADGVYLRVAARSVEAGIAFLRTRIALAPWLAGERIFERRS